MKIIKLSALFLTGTLAFASCNQFPQNDSVYNNPEQIYNDVQGDPGYGETEMPVQYVGLLPDLQINGATARTAPSRAPASSR